MKKILEDLPIRNIVVEEDKEDVNQITETPNATAITEKFKIDSLKTADPITLLLMCYEIAKNSLKKAINGIREKNYELKYEGISKALRVFDILMATTEPNEVGKQIIKSYLFITQKITEADIKKDDKMLEKVIEYIEELESAWKQIKSNPNKQNQK